MKKSIAVIDCAIKDPAIACFNRLQRNTDKLLSYHNFPLQRERSLNLEEEVEGLIVLGSHSNVGDGSDWHPPLKNYILQKLEEGIPVLGICFAHQLMAHCFGSKLKRNDGEALLEGVRSIELKNKIWEINKKELSFFTAHNYQIEKLGDDLEVFGTSSDSPFELLRHKDLPYWSCQSHPEGSDFFLENEITLKLETYEKEKAKSDGLLFLKAFISQI